MLGKIIKIENETVKIGDENGEVLTFNKEQLDFSPTIGNEVEVYGSGNEAIIRLAVKKNEGVVTDPNQTTMQLIAFILNLLTTITLAVFIIPLAWTIPMTVHSYRIYKGIKINTVTFAVCTLLFLNFISGILLLFAQPKEA